MCLKLVVVAMTEILHLSNYSHVTSLNTEMAVGEASNVVNWQYGLLPIICTLAITALSVKT